MANTAINHDPAATFPGSSTDTAVVKWSGTGGKTLANSGVTIDSSNNVTVPGNITTTGYIHLTGDTKELRFYENGNFIAIKAPSLGADYTLTLPINDGAASEFLQTDGNGVLVWAAVHADAHTVVSHSDTTATGAELETLTDGSTTSLHAHSGGGPTEATKANMEGEATGTIYAPPDLVKNSPGVAKVWCKILIGGGLDSPDYNVSTIGDNQAGDRTINFSTAFSTNVFTCVGAIMAGSQEMNLIYYSQAVGSIRHLIGLSISPYTQVDIVTGTAIFGDQ